MDGHGLQFGKSMKIEERFGCGFVTKTFDDGNGHAVGEVAALFLDSDACAWNRSRSNCEKRSPTNSALLRGKFHAGSLELPVGMVRSVGDAIVLSVSAVKLRQVLAGAALPLSLI